MMHRCQVAETAKSEHIAEAGNVDQRRLRLIRPIHRTLFVPPGVSNIKDPNTAKNSSDNLGPISAVCDKEILHLMSNY